MISRFAAALACVALLLVYHEPIAVYVQDQHYQSHFLFLWVFCGVALYRAAKHRVFGSVRCDRRALLGLGALAIAVLLLHAGLVTGASTLQRLSLVATFAGMALLAWRGISARRCLGCALFMLLCFGVPYSAYFQLTQVLLLGIRGWLDVPCWLGLASYRVEDLTIVFPHYRLTITGDCSGMNQLVTFLGLAFLGTLTSVPSWRRTLSLFGLAGALPG